MTDDAAPMGDDAAPAAERNEAELDGLYLKLKTWFRVDRDASAPWRREAKLDYDFAAGHQWDEADVARLRSEGREPVTFNRLLPVVKAVCGSEINNRQEIQYKPRQVGAAGLNEVLTESGRYLAQEAEAEDEESDAFCDLSICGMGWLETRVDYERKPDGDYVEDRVDPLEMYWDATARKRNLDDARRVFRARRMDLDGARALFPGADPEELDAAWAEERDGGEPHRNPASPVDRALTGGSGESDAEDGTREVCIVEAQWYDLEKIVRFADPMTGEVTALPAAEFKVFASRLAVMTGGIQIQTQEGTRRVYRKAFLGSKVLEAPTPTPAGDRFSYFAMTGDRDRNKGLWFGLIRPMRDPQRYANKFFAQTLDILNRQAKGGMIMEKGAVPDQAAFEKSWAKPGATSWVGDGTIAADRMKEKPLPQLPTGHFQLMSFVLTSIRDVSGVNLEMLGQQTQEQAGVLEAQRKKSALTILATLFDALRRCRKGIGRARLHIIQNYLSDGRLVRIVEQGVQQYIPLVRDQVAGEYDVIVDDAPTSTDQKEIIWATFSSIFPVIKDMLTPQVIAEILPYSPFPASFVAKMQAIMAQGATPDPAKQAAQELALKEVAAKIEEHAASANLKNAQAGRESALTQHSAIDTVVNAVDTLRQPVQQPKAVSGEPRAPLPGGAPGAPSPAPIGLPGMLPPGLLGPGSSALGPMPGPTGVTPMMPLAAAQPAPGGFLAP